MKTWDPPKSAVGEWHLHPPNNDKKLVPGMDNVDVWFGDTGNAGHSSPMPVFVGGSEGIVWKHTPDPKKARLPKPKNIIVANPGPGSGVVKIGTFTWPERGGH